MKSIEITISPKGDTKIETKGFTGGSCRNASRNLERALGLVQSDAATAEFYQAQPVQNQQQQRG